MPLVSSMLVTSFAAVWLTIGWLVQRRLHSLTFQLPAAYTLELTQKPDEHDTGQFLLLAIDLHRKAPCTDPFEALSSAEKRIALIAYAIQTQPRWMHPFITWRLGRADKRLVQQLRAIRSSRPNHPKRHFGAIRQAKGL